MKRAAAAVLVALALTASAQAADLPGVHEEPRYEPAATFVASILAYKPIKVYCGNDAAGWQQTLATAYPDGVPFPPLGPAGFADTWGTWSGGEYLSPTTCNTLATRSIYSRGFAYAVLTLAHEAVHLSGVLSPYDEWGTDCTAVSDVWAVAGLYFDVRQPALTAVHEAALAAHLQKPPNYRGTGSC